MLRRDAWTTFHSCCSKLVCEQQTTIHTNYIVACLVVVELLFCSAVVLHYECCLTPEQIDQCIRYVSLQIYGCLQQSAISDMKCGF